MDFQRLFTHGKVMSAVPTGLRMNDWFRQPHATHPKKQNRFLGTPVKRGANKHCASGAGDWLAVAMEIVSNAL